MCKNKLLFTIFSFFSLTTITSENTISTEKKIEVVTSTVETLEAAEVLTPTTETIEIADATAPVIEAVPFTPMKFTLTFTVTPGANPSIDDFNSIIIPTKELITAGHRGAPNLYQSLLIFIKELQEAIVAGMNLFAIASTSQETITTVAEEVAIEAITETVENALAKINQQANENNISKGFVDRTKNNLIFAYSVTVDKIENLALWESVKTQMISLADALNMRTKSPTELSNMLEKIAQEAQPLYGSVMTISTNNPNL